MAAILFERARLYARRGRTKGSRGKRDMESRNKKCLEEKSWTYQAQRDNILRMHLNDVVGHTVPTHTVTPLNPCRPSHQRVVGQKKAGFSVTKPVASRHLSESPVHV